jgi:hypothetical protein
MLDRIGKGTREGSLFFSREVAYKKTLLFNHWQSFFDISIEILIGK